MYDVFAVSLTRSGAPGTEMYDLLMVSWSRSGAPTRRCTIWLPVSWSVAGVFVSKWCPSTKMYDLLPVSWSRSGAPALRCTICCRCLALDVVPQHEDVRFVASVLALLPGVLVSGWCPSTTIYDLLPVSWSRSDAPALRCMICFGCLCLEVVPRH